MKWSLMIAVGIVFLLGAYIGLYLANARIGSYFPYPALQDPTVKAYPAPVAYTYVPVWSQSLFAPAHALDRRLRKSYWLRSLQDYQLDSENWQTQTIR